MKASRHQAVVSRQDCCLPVILGAHARSNRLEASRFGALKNFLLRLTVTYCAHAVVFGLLKGDRMESISLLLGEALSPYQVTLTPSGAKGECLVTLRNASGAIMVERMFNQAQLTDKRQLTDVVDGLHRDVMIAEGRLEPCVIAALRNLARDKVIPVTN